MTDINPIYSGQVALAHVLVLSSRRHIASVSGDQHDKVQDPSPRQQRSKRLSRRGASHP